MEIEFDYKPIKDLCEILSGSTPKTSEESYWGGSELWITPAEIQNNSEYIFDTKKTITKLAAQKTNLKLLPKGAILLSTRAPIGKVAIVGKEMYFNQGFKSLICTDEINEKYLFYFLKFSEKKLNLLGRGATFKEISKEIVGNIIVPVPSLAEQHRLVGNLDLIGKLITKYKTQLNDLDCLVKSRFIEMFGSASEKVPLESLLQPIEKANKKFDKHSLVEYIDISSIDNSSGAIIGTTEYVFGEAPSRAQQSVKSGDVLVSLVRPNLKNVALIEDNRNNLVASSGFCVLRAKNGYPEYIMGIVTSDDFTDSMVRATTGANYPAIHTVDVKKYLVPAASNFKQQEYSEFYSAIAKSKLAIEKSIGQLEILKKKLMQEYFG